MCLGKCRGTRGDPDTVQRQPRSPTLCQPGGGGWAPRGDPDEADLRGRMVRGRGHEGAWLAFVKEDATGLGQSLGIVR